MRSLDVCLAAALALAGCSALSPRRNPDEKPIEIVKGGAPKKPFVKVGRLDFHVDKGSSNDPPSMEDFRAELESRARSAGADAVMDIDWTLKGTPDAGIYHVMATAISYRVPTPGPAAEARAAPAEVAVLTDPPARPFTKVSSLDLWVEKKAPGDGSLEEVLPELKRQARLSGAEAVIDVHWKLGGGPDALVYHVTATGIAFSAPAASAAPPEAAPR